MSKDKKIEVPVNGGMLILRQTSFFGLSEQERAQVKKRIMDELKRAYDDAEKKGIAFLLVPANMEVLYIGPDGKANKLEATEE